MQKPEIRKLTSFWHEKTYGNTSRIYRLLKGVEFGNVGVDVVRMAKQKTLQPHYHLRPKIRIFIIEGSGFVYLNGKEQKIHKGDVIMIPPKTWHGFRTVHAPLIFLSIQSPPIYGKDAEKDTYFE